MERIALVFTSAYIVFIAAIYGERIPDLGIMPLNEVGDFLAGVFGPLAFLWLVVGYFQQRKELKQNTKALELQADELKKSVTQQTEIARTTREQLLRDRPFFVVVENKTNMPDGDPIVQLRNAGGSAVNVRVESDDSMELWNGALTELRFDVWPNGQEKSLPITAMSDDIMQDEPTISVAYEDYYGREYDQIFSVYYYTRNEESMNDVYLFKGIVKSKMAKVSNRGFGDDEAVKDLRVP